eukprot:TRINITY_DN29619_c0_g1_i1.p1 TRINITY_DN29619_c0_g1~~TRINITY_DN29619_c0_g1_i1.p1  ORF type:complete len:642 (+),score=119.67 TRINITY_DN29619_c0_g1_i1:95-2020(+)
MCIRDRPNPPCHPGSLNLVSTRLVRPFAGAPRAPEDSGQSVPCPPFITLRRLGPVIGTTNPKPQSAQHASQKPPRRQRPFTSRVNGSAEGKAVPWVGELSSANCRHHAPQTARPKLYRNPPPATDSTSTTAPITEAVDPLQYFGAKCFRFAPGLGSATELESISETAVASQESTRSEDPLDELDAQLLELQTQRGVRSSHGNRPSEKLRKELELIREEVKLWDGMQENLIAEVGADLPEVQLLRRATERISELVEIQLTVSNRRVCEAEEADRKQSLLAEEKRELNAESTQQAHCHDDVPMTTAGPVRPNQNKRPASQRAPHVHPARSAHKSSSPEKVCHKPPRNKRGNPQVTVETQTLEGEALGLFYKTEKHQQSIKTTCKGRHPASKSRKYQLPTVSHIFESQALKCRFVHGLNGVVGWTSSACHTTDKPGRFEPLLLESATRVNGFIENGFASYSFPISGEPALGFTVKLEAIRPKGSSGMLDATCGFLVMCASLNEKPDIAQVLKEVSKKHTSVSGVDTKQEEQDVEPGADYVADTRETGYAQISAPAGAHPPGSWNVYLGRSMFGIQDVRLEFAISLHLHTRLEESARELESSLQSLEDASAQKMQGLEQARRICTKATTSAPGSAATSPHSSPQP